MLLHMTKSRSDSRLRYCNDTGVTDSERLSVVKLRSARLQTVLAR